MKIAEIIEEYVSGDWGSDELSTNTPNAVACIRGADFAPILSVDYSNIPTRYISNNAYENKRLREGDIIIEKSGGSPTQSTGRVIIVTRDLLREKCDIICSNFCEAFRVKEGWNPFYVFSYLQFLCNQGVFFNFEGKTSGLKNLQMEQAFRSIDIPTQKSDISILNSIDKKISLNRRINIELDSIAKQIYDYWFVQFDFPNEEGNPYKSSGGKMVWNKTLKREIPEGWKVNAVEDCIIHVNTGLNPRQNFVLGNGGIKYLTVKNLKTDGTIDFSNCDVIDEDAWDKVHRRSDIQINDILFASIAPFGRCHIILREPLGWDINESVFSIRPRQANVSPYYLYLYFTDKWFVQKAEKESAGSIFAGIRVNSLLKIPILVSPKIIYTKFDNCISSIFRIKDILSTETEHLNSLRNYLLPLLMNGQVTIKD